MRAAIDAKTQKRPQSAPNVKSTIVRLDNDDASSPVHNFAIRAQLRKKYGTAHVAWRVVAGTKTEVDRKTLYVGLYRAGIVLNQSQFEAVWKLCDPEESGLLGYGHFCSVFASSDASASIHRKVPTGKKATMRMGLRTSEGQYLGFSLEHCVYDAADSDNGTSLTFEAFERAVQRAKLNLGEDGIREVWSSCLAKAASPSKVTSTSDLAHRYRQPFPDTGARGTSDMSRKLPLAGGLPTRPSRRVPEAKVEAQRDKYDGEPPVVLCALALRELREVVASSLMRQSYLAQPTKNTPNLETPAEQYTVDDLVSQWWGAFGDASMST